MSSQASLVEPFILGASSGASFGAAFAIIFPALFLPIQISAFIFALIAVLSSYMLARQKGEINTVGLVLSGVITGSIFSALVSIMKYLSEDTQLREITFWMMGGLYHASWSDIYINAILILISPKLAPLDAPSIKGSTSGFLKQP